MASYSKALSGEENLAAFLYQDRVNRPDDDKSNLQSVQNMRNEYIINMSQA
jgi:hypothetical protein